MRIRANKMPDSRNSAVERSGGPGVVPSQAKPGPMPTASSIYRQRVIEQVGDVPEEYLPALLRVVSAFRESVALVPAEESFRLGWSEVQRGEVRPTSELWVGIEGESGSE